MRTNIVSVIVPSRGRPKQLLTSLESLIRNADRTDLIEIVVGLDSDDIDSKNLPQTLQSQFREVDFRFEIFPRFGYDRLEEYWNFLGLRSRGDWVLLWNDDALMESRSWDTLFRKSLSSSVIVIFPDVLNEPLQTLFPVVSRNWIALFGRISPWNHADSYIWAVVGPSGLWKRERSVRIRHSRLSDVTTSEISYHRIPLPRGELYSDRQKLRQFMVTLPTYDFARAATIGYGFSRLFALRRWQKNLRRFPLRGFLNRLGQKFEAF